MIEADPRPTSITLTAAIASWMITFLVIHVNCGK